MADRWSHVLAIVLAVFVAVSSVGAQSDDGASARAAVAAGPKSPLDGLKIGRIDVVGLSVIDESYVRNRIRSRTGEPYSEAEVQRDRVALFRTERFLDVRCEAELVDGEVKLTFRLLEKPEVAAITFIGNEEYDDKDLLDELTFAVGDPLDLYEVRQGRSAIEQLYREKGYAYVTVEYDAEALRTRQEVVYTIVENQRVRVTDVNFEGNVMYTDSELKRQIQTKSYVPVFRTGDFDPDQAERDAITLRDYYRDRGYLDAEVGYVSEFSDVAREKLEVTFRVNEGTRYKVGQVILTGNTVIPDDELAAMMILTKGEFFQDVVLQSEIKKLETEYGSRGYIDARVVSSWVYSGSVEDEVILTLTIREGRQFNVGLVEIHGNARTQDKCARREIRLYPGDVYDVRKMTKAEESLRGSGLFSKATVEAVAPESGEADERDLLATLEENPRTNQFIAGIGASSDSGFLGNLVLENTNFDLFDRPRSWGEFFRGRAFRGAGQTARIQLEPGTEINRFRIDFREPYLMDKPVGFGSSFYLFSRGRDGYDESRLGGNVSFDRRFEEGWLENWAGEVALRGELVNVSDRDSWAAQDIKDVDGDNVLTSIKLSMLRDTTDSRFDPTRGYRLRLSWEQAGAMGGDFTHSKLTGSYTRHWTVAVDERDRRSVVSTHVKAGQILGDAPLFERFYAGGIGSMRGFDFRGISPRDGIRNNRVGGDFMLTTGAEYSFPMYDKIIRGVFFVDMGTVERDFGISSWRAAVGGGIRLTLDIFGTIPMEFDLAYPIARDEEDDTRVFSFFIGLPFF